MEIPQKKHWELWRDDLDLHYAFKMLGGKSRAQAAPLFLENPIERAEDLRFSPKAPFQYYILAYADAIMSPQGRTDDNAPDLAACFLNLLEDKAKNAPDFLTTIWNTLRPVAEHVAAHQLEYDADVEIYGDFPTQVKKIKAIMP